MQKTNPTSNQSSSLVFSPGGAFESFKRKNFQPVVRKAFQEQIPDSKAKNLKGRAFQSSKSTKVASPLGVSSPAQESEDIPDEK